MYYRKDAEQGGIEEFFLPFGGKLRKDNRWVRMAEMMLWNHIEEIYAQNLSGETGRPALSSRIAFGLIFIKEYEKLSDEETVQNIQENAYMQYFLGLHEFHGEALFDPSMMVYFRKRFPVEEIAKINEYICTGKWPDEQRNVDRNDEEDSPLPPAGAADEPESASAPEKQSPKPNRKTSKQKQQKNREKTVESC